MAKRILVPLDRTREAEAVLPLIADVARGGGATVRLLHVAPVPEILVNPDGHVIAYADQEMARLEVEAVDYLQTAEARLNGCAVERAVRFGDPVEEIVLEADGFGTDLIVFISSCKGGLRRLVLGGTAEQVARRTDTSVLVLRPARAYVKDHPDS